MYTQVPHPKPYRDPGYRSSLFHPSEPLPLQSPTANSPSLVNMPVSTIGTLRIPTLLILPAHHNNNNIIIIIIAPYSIYRLLMFKSSAKPPHLPTFNHP
jgi:hypothetical protein